MLVHLCHHVSPVDQSANTHLEEWRRKQHWQSGKVKKKKIIIIKKKERERGLPSWWGLQGPRGRQVAGRQTCIAPTSARHWAFGSTKMAPSSCLSENTRSMGPRIPAQRLQDVVWSSWSRFTWRLRWAICTPAWFTPGFHLCSSLHTRRWTALQSQPSRSTCVTYSAKINSEGF